MLRTFDFVFASGGQAKSGFFHAASDGRHRPGSTRARSPTRAPGRAPQLYKHARSWHLVRRSGDVLYFMLKQLALLERQDEAFKAKPSWTAGLQACADAFVTLWDRYRQLGQFVNVETGQLIVGGSTAGAIVPAALALAARAFKNDDYQRVAVAAAEAYHQRVVRSGVTNGGAPDALQCPDSESAAALLESCVVLFETTGERAWIDRAAAVAHQLATWQISYDFRFPAASALAQADIQTTGAVVANAQNKSAAPGFLLYSGDALLKLYRATGKTLYLEMLRDTAHNVTQYLNRQDHRLHAASELGTTCARIDTSDAAGAVGDTTPLLTVAERDLRHADRGRGARPVRAARHRVRVRLRSRRRAHQGEDPKPPGRDAGQPHALRRRGARAGREQRREREAPRPERAVGRAGRRRCPPGERWIWSWSAGRFEWMPAASPSSPRGRTRGVEVVAVCGRSLRPLTLTLSPADGGEGIRKGPMEVSGPPRPV